MNILKVIKNFKTGKRESGEEFLYYSEDDKFSEFITECHLGKWPSDFTFVAVRDACVALRKSWYGELEALAYLETSATNHELCKWLVDFHSDIDELIDDCGIDRTGDLMSVIHSAYGAWRELILMRVTEWFEGPEEEGV